MQTIKMIGRPICMLHERERATDQHLLFEHLEDLYMPLIDAYDGIIITTRRPFEDIRASWVRRGKDLAELEKQIANYRRLLERRPYILELGACR